MTALLDRPLLFVTGKGGVGKSTVAAALALAAAARGRRTVLAEVAGQSRGPELLGAQAAEPGHEAEVADGVWATTLHPPLALEEFVASVLGSRRLVRILTQSNAFSSFVNAAPGARELVGMTKAWELAQDRRWDRRLRGYDTVVVDAPASGHAMGMLGTPRTFAEIARVGPIHSQARRVHEWLCDSRRSGVVAVALPSELPVTETLELEERLRRSLGRRLDAVVMNGVLPRRFSAADLERVDAAGGADGTLVAAALRAARAEAGRVRSQQSQLQRLRRATGGDVATLPFVFAPHVEREDVERFARELERRLG